MADWPAPLTVFDVGAPMLGAPMLQVGVRGRVGPLVPRHSEAAEIALLRLQVDVLSQHLTELEHRVGVLERPGWWRRRWEAWCGWLRWRGYAG